MLNIGKKKGEQKEGYGFATQEVNNTQNLLQIEEKRTMSIEEMFSEKGFCFGKSYSKPTEHNKAYWNLESKKTLNYSIAIIGGSGSGKTRYAVHVIDYLGRQNKNVIVMDVQGDMHVPGEQVFKLTRRNNDVGFNYFTFTKDEDNGGPISNANMIIELYKNSVMDRGFGPIQKAVFKQAIIDCYRSKGIYEEDESTWDNELPTPAYFEQFIQKILGNASSNKITDFTQLLNTMIDLKGKVSQSDEESKEKIEKKMSEEIGRFRDLSSKFEDYLLENKHSAFFEGIKFDEKNFDISFYYIASNFKALSTLYTYVKIMADCPLFGNKPFPEIKGVVRFDISGYTTYGKPEEAIFFINYVLTMFFRSIKERGEYRFLPKEYREKHGEFCDSFCFVDESKLILPSGPNKENPYHIINRIVTEARKYGGGMGIISQRLNHFSGELINSIYTKVILKSEQSDVDNATKILGIKAKDNLEPKILFSHISNSKDGVAVVGTTGGLYDSLVTPWYVKND